MSDRLIDVDEAARILTLAPGTVRAMVYRGELPVIRPAGRRAIRFRLSDILCHAQLAVPEPTPQQAAIG